MTVIKGGSNGNVANVTQDNQLATAAETKDHDHVKNEADGSVWTASFLNIDPTAADDNFFYLQNTGTIDLEITDIRITSTVAGQLAVNKVSGTVVGGTTIVPLSKNTAKTVTPLATVEQAVDLTGLTDVGSWYLVTLVANVTYELKTSSRIILGPTGALALQWGEATGILTGTVSFNED